VHHEKGNKAMTQSEQDAATIGLKFGQLYAYLDSIRTLARDAERVGSLILQTRDLENVQIIGQYANAAIGLVLAAQQRELNVRG
jgi:hypothetical protein